VCFSVQGHDAHARSISHLGSGKASGAALSFDAGEGCQINLKKAKLGLSLSGFGCQPSSWRSLPRGAGDSDDAGPGAGRDPLTILGPPGTERFIRQIRESLAFFLDYPLSFLDGRKEVRKRLMKMSWSVSCGGP